MAMPVRCLVTCYDTQTEEDYGAALLTSEL